MKSKFLVLSVFLNVLLILAARAGQTLDTGIMTTLDGKRGTSTATFAVQDGDSIAAVVVSDGNPSRNLQFVLAKE